MQWIVARSYEICMFEVNLRAVNLTPMQLQSSIRRIEVCSDFYEKIVALPGANANVKVIRNRIRNCDLWKLPHGNAARTEILPELWVPARRRCRRIHGDCSF